jgi:hypothetical protein
MTKGIGLLQQNQNQKGGPLRQSEQNMLPLKNTVNHRMYDRRSDISLFVKEAGAYTGQADPRQADMRPKCGMNAVAKPGFPLG